MLTVMCAALLARQTVGQRWVADVRPLDRARRQFWVDFLLFAAAGVLAGAFGLLVWDFPFSVSGSKLVLGSVTFGVFAGIDLALERERIVIGDAVRYTVAYRRPPEALFPITRMFSLFAIVVLLLVTVVLLMVITGDFYWLAGAQGGRDALVRSVLLDVMVVMGALTILVVNLVVSYSRNLKMLFANQTRVLEQIRTGDFSSMVPVATRDEFGVIAGHTNHMIEGLRDRVRLKHGMSLAREVQMRLLPSGPPTLPGVDMAGSLSYSDETGGDYYDFLPRCCGGGVGVVVGDVSGHGIGAAMLMTTVRGLLRLRAELPGTLGECLTDVNRLLTRDTYGTGRFMTLFYIKFGAEDGLLHWACAGHDPALLYRLETNEFEELNSGDMPLGVADDVQYRDVSGDPLRPGDIVSLGTDGIWETLNEQGEMFGKQRLREVIRSRAASPAREIVQAVWDAVAEFSGNGRQEDDRTLVIVKAAS